MRNESPQGSSNPLGLDPAEILRSLRKRWPIALFAFVLLTASAVFATTRIPPQYQSRARLIMDPTTPRVLDEGAALDEAAERYRRQSEFVNTQMKVIKSRPVLLDAVMQSQLREDDAFFSERGLLKERSNEDLANILEDMTSVSHSKTNSLVDISVRAFAPDRAARLADAIGQAYIDYSLEQRLEGARQASRWLDQRVVELARDLETKEGQLQSFREQNLLVSLSLEDRQNMSSSRLSLLNERLMDTKSRLFEKEAFQQAFGTESMDGLAQSSLASAEKVSVIGDLRSDLVKLRLERAQLATRYEEKHPEMQAIQRRMEEVVHALELEEGVLRQSMLREIDGLKETISSLESEMEKEKREALAINSVGLKYAQLSRDADNTREIYQSLLRRQSEVELSGLLEANFVRWFQRAEPKGVPVSPSMLKNSLLGAAAGILLALLIVLGTALLDNSIHGREDIEALGLAFLGVYPRILTPIRRKESSSLDEKTPERDLFVLENPSSQAAECARSIRTNLIFMSTGRPLKKILISSPRPSEGKTTTTIALGVTMAQAGNRVLLVDTDLRRPSLHRSFSIPRSDGLTNLLLGDEPDKAIKASSTPNMDILPCGRIPPNPSELLHTARFHEVIDRLAESYDRILFDSPPLCAVVDSTILSKIVDGTLIVALSDDTPKESLRQAISRLRDVDANILGVVLNDFESSREDYGYGYNYSYKAVEEH